MAVSAAKERFHIEPYELSQDLIAKQLEVLEKKYGGSHRAKNAALTIQRAFRRYSMQKKFSLLAAQGKSANHNKRRAEAQTNIPSIKYTLNNKYIKNWDRTPKIHPSKNLPVIATRTVERPKCSSPGHHRSNTSSSLCICSSPNRVKQVAVNHRLTYVSTPSKHGGQKINYDNKTAERIWRPKINKVSPTRSSIDRKVSNARSESVAKEKICQSSVDSDEPSNQNITEEVTNNSFDFQVPWSFTANIIRKINSTNNPSIASKRSISQVSTQYKTHQSIPLQRSNSVKIAPSELEYHVHSTFTSIFSNPMPVRKADSENVLPTKCSLSRPNNLNRDIIPHRCKDHEVIRKRQYRVGLNIFNRKPEKGISYFIQHGFLQYSPHLVARFLIKKDGLSKQMIGEYLGNLMHKFNMDVLDCFVNEIDFKKMPLDEALRHFQSYFRLPGEAQKIERLVKVFSARYCQCNPNEATKLKSVDTLFILSFAVIMLHTDLHTPNIKAEKRMKLEDFVRNLRNIDDGHDLDFEMLSGIYERIKSSEFRPGSDHVTQVMKVQQTIVAKCPNLALPHRRLVCYCRLYEVNDPNKKERPGLHQREVFLFNDILVITKIHSRKKNTVTYTFRQSFLLAGLSVTTFETQHYPYGIRVTQKWDRKLVLTLNARNEHDRTKFVEDMKESIAEMDEMETLRLESELEKQRLSVVSSNSTTSNTANINNNNSKSSNDLHMVNRDNRDSGITGDSLSTEGSNDQLMRHSAQGLSIGGSKGSGNSNGHLHPNGGVVLRKSAINNSLLDLTDASEKMARRGSVGSLDSGMSISFVHSGVTPTTVNVQSNHHSGDSHHNQSPLQHHHQHSVSRVMNNGANAMHPVVGTCNNCMNPVSLSVGSSNHASSCYHHMHHMHHLHHHHNHHIQQDHQHRHPSSRSHDPSSTGVGNVNHTSNTVASITSALL